MAKKKAPARRTTTTVDVLPEMPGRIVFMGCGIPQKKAKELAAAMRRKLGEGK
jgi:hypothetical protein